MSIDKIKQTIQNLLAVAENEASTEGEIRNAMAMATRLMRKHNLAREDIQAKDDGTFDVEKVGMARRSVCCVGVKRTQWEMRLARFVSKFIGTVNWYYNTRSRRLEPSGKEASGRMYGACVTFYGPEEDVLLACNLFRDTGLRIQARGRERFGGYAKGEGAVYCQGFVQGLSEANARVERDAIEDASTPGERGLILANQQLNRQLVERASHWLSTEVGLKLSSGTSLSGGSGSRQAYNAGVRDGRNTKVSKNRPARIN